MDLSQIAAEREARKEALAKAKEAQLAVDLAALNDLEIEHGDDNVASVEVNRYAPGLVTLVVVRPLRKAELKRFRDRTKDGGDATVAADEAGECALLYPARDSEEWKATKDAMPGIVSRAGLAAIELAAGVARSEGK